MEFDWKKWFMDVWEDNRRLTNNVAHALVEAGAMDKVLVDGMRPFRELTLEILGMERWNVRGLAYDQWEYEAHRKCCACLPLPRYWNSEGVCVKKRGSCGRVSHLTRWPRCALTPAPYVPEGTAIGWLTYALENEIHHRGQGYVYLRLLGQEPPAFYIRTEC